MNVLSFFLLVKDFLSTWQTLIGSMIGAIAPLFVLWCAEKYKKRKEIKDYLYYLERIIVDQINAVIEIESTAITFLESRLATLQKNINNNPTTAYSVEGAFFPLLSVRSIPHEVNNKSSGSGYIDNKVGKIYAMSNDLPHIIDDIRFQLRDTLERNEKISFGKLNPPEVQKEQFKSNIKEYARMMREDLLENNIPLYLSKLTETLIAVREKNTLHPFRWKIRFDPRWKFYVTKNKYLLARSEIMENMDLYFKAATDKKLEEINRLRSASKR